MTSAEHTTGSAGDSRRKNEAENCLATPHSPLDNPTSPAAVSQRRADQGPGAAVFSPDGKQIATNSNFGLQIWDALDSREVIHLSQEGKAILQLAIDAKSESIAAVRGFADETPEVTVWDIPTKRLLLNLGRPTLRVADVAYSAAGLRLAVQEGERVNVFDHGKTTELCHVQGTRPRFSGDGSRICTLLDRLTDKCRVLVWDAASGKQLAMARLDDGVNGYALLSNGGDRLACIDGGRVHVWDVATATQLSSLENHEWIFFRACVSRDRPLMAAYNVDPDGTRLVTGGNSSIILWDTATGREVLSLGASLGRVSAVVFSPDGKTIAAGDSNGGCCVWKVED